MVVNYLLLLTLFLIYTFVNIIKIALRTKGGFYPVLIETIAFFTFMCFLVHFFYCVFIFFNVQKLTGKDGPTGLEGPPGEPGSPGHCNANCGQKVCVSLVLNEIRNYLEKKGINKDVFTNKLIIDKISKMCFSDNYYGLLMAKNKNRPNEKKLIEYITKIVKLWIDLILKHRDGKRFLMETSAQRNYFARNNPFDEIEKYDLWNWGESYKLKPIVRIQCAEQTNLPQGSKDLDAIYTSDYDSVYTSTIPKNIYGPDETKCPHFQLGKDRSNPRGLKVCYSDSPVGIHNVYIETKYKPFTQSFTFYNPTITTDYFILGSIWRGKVDLETNPEKYTVVLKDTTSSQNALMAPKRFELIRELTNGAKIYRPICEEDYVSLGDYVSLTIPDPSTTNFRCIHKKYVKEVSYDYKVWNNDGYKQINYNEAGKETSVNELQDFSIWPIGYNNINEEVKNYPRLAIRTTGGFSFFRASSHKSRKPIEKAYVVKRKFLNEIVPPIIKGENTELGFGWLGGKPREDQYNVYKELGISNFGIISHYDEGTNIKSYYIEHVKDKVYGIKAYNKDSGDFDLYYTKSRGNVLGTTEKLNKENSNSLFELILVLNRNGKTVKANGLPLIRLKNVETGFFLQQGLQSLELINSNTGSQFRFQSFNGTAV